MGKRTDLDFTKHELEIIKHNGITIHHLRIPDTNVASFKFINACGVLIVTGDYSNWIFAREFHPQKGNYVSDEYWCEKLRMNSHQKSHEFDSKATEARLNELLKEADRSEIDKLYYELCLSHVDEDEMVYLAYASMERPLHYDENIPYEEKIIPQLLYVFDAFEEICSRMDDPDTKIRIGRESEPVCPHPISQRRKIDGIYSCEKCGYIFN